MRKPCESLYRRLEGNKSWGLPRGRRTGPLDVDKVDIVGRGVNHGPEGHRIGNLSVEPNVLIGREEPAEFRADEANNVAQHRDEDQASIESENETGTTRRPDRPFEGVEASKPSIGVLFPCELRKWAMIGVNAPGCTNHIRRRRNVSRRR